jgi:hypothetical protein
MRENEQAMRHGAAVKVQISELPKVAGQAVPGAEAARVEAVARPHTVCEIPLAKPPAQSGKPTVQLHALARPDSTKCRFQPVTDNTPTTSPRQPRQPRTRIVTAPLHS